MSLATALVPASADQAGPLVSQRQALQQQVSGLGGEKAKALSDLLSAQDALNNLQAALRGNTAYLADLNAEQDGIRGRIANTEHDLAQQRSLVNSLTRGQYKTMTGDQAMVLVFNSANFREMLSRVMAEITVQRRVADTARHIKSEQLQLKAMSADLTKKQGQAAQVQSNLEQENGKELALVADYDQRVAHIDGQSKAILGQISSLNQQIAVAQAPPPAPAPRARAASASASTSAFGPGSGTVNGGGSCGNHFSYG
ncbi:MAG: hypothetical protein M3010_10310, partial [Candidatus Dormibacteraeota bacterium]|nr:hypothetical protein [Candidatus Dormibacteraeota bacterium]